MDLGLEGKVSKLGEIYVSYLKQCPERLHLILKTDISVFIHISEIPGQNSAILREILVELISELKPLVELDLELNLSGKNRLSKKLFEVFRDIITIHSFNFSIGHLRDSADSVDVALCAYESHNVHCHTL